MKLICTATVLVLAGCAPCTSVYDCDGDACQPDGSCTRHGGRQDAQCIGGDQCAAQLTCNSGLCEPPAAVGEGCQHDWDCQGQYCNAGVCSLPGSGEAGAYCERESYCGPDLTCGQVCLPALPAGGDCRVATESCVDGLICKEGTCG